MWSPCRCDRTTKSRLVRSTFFAFTFAAKMSLLSPVSNRMRLPAISTSAERPQSLRIEASFCGDRQQHARDCAYQKQLHELCHYKFFLLLYARSFWLAGTSIIQFAGS